MRSTAWVIMLCAGLLCSHIAAAVEQPQRWVSAGGALTEWVSALGAESKLVGVDSTSQHPESLKNLPSIGYQRQLSAEGILSLRPQVLIGTEEMGPPPVLSQMRSAGVQVELFSARADLPALQSNLQHLGKLMGSEDKATQLFEQFAQQLRQQQAWISQAQEKQAAPGVLLLLGQAGGNLLIAGKDTAADWLLRESGGRNLATHKGYKPFSVELLAELNPQVLVFADRSLSGAAARTALFKQNPILASSDAAKAGRVFEVDPTLLVGGLGPRLPHTLKRLSAEFYPAEARNAP